MSSRVGEDPRPVLVMRLVTGLARTQLQQPGLGVVQVDDPTSSRPLCCHHAGGATRPQPAVVVDAASPPGGRWPTTRAAPRSSPVATREPANTARARSQPVVMTRMSSSNYVSETMSWAPRRGVRQAAGVLPALLDSATEPFNRPPRVDGRDGAPEAALTALPCLGHRLVTRLSSGAGTWRRSRVSTRRRP